MIWIIALLIAAGCGYLGWTLGLLLFAALFEIARLADLAGPLNSPDALQSFRAVSAAVCLAAGLRYVRPWLPEESGLDRAKTWRRTSVLAVLGGIGGATLGHLAGTELAATAYAPILLAGLLLGVLLVGWKVGPEGGSLLGRTTLVVAVAGAVLLVCVTVSKRLEFRYERLGERSPTELRTR